MTFPSKLPLNEPYSTIQLQTNLKEREVYCPYCKYIIKTSLAGPKCGDCTGSLITVINSK